MSGDGGGRRAVRPGLVDFPAESSCNSPRMDECGQHRSVALRHAGAQKPDCNRSAASHISLTGDMRPPCAHTAP